MIPESQAVAGWLETAHTNGLLSVAAIEGTGKSGTSEVPRYKILAWLARKAPTLVHHFPAIHGESAKSKGIADIPTIALVTPDTVRTPQSQRQEGGDGLFGPGGAGGFHHFRRFSHPIPGIKRCIESIKME